LRANQHYTALQSWYWESKKMELAMSKKNIKKANKQFTQMVAPQPVRALPVAPPAPALQAPVQAAVAAPTSSPMVVPQQKTTPPKGKVPFVFLEPAAKRVSLSGEFNNWSPDAIPMERGEGGQWKASLVLPAGRYQYKFVVDGQWLPDPNAREQATNSFGTLNSVIEVQA
jgi:hypothetical protein